MPLWQVGRALFHLSQQTVCQILAFAMHSATQAAEYALVTVPLVCALQQTELRIMTKRNSAAFGILRDGIVLARTAYTFCGITFGESA